MPNVKFLKGTQTNLAKYLVSGNTEATEGAFYLTSDTNRLYIGKDIGSGTIRAVPVNQGVISVTNIQALPGTGEQGQFYYAEQENVLCVYSGDEWIQINPDNNTYSDGRTVTTSYSSTTSTVSITDIVYNNDGSRLSSNWDVKAGDGLDAAVSPKYTRASKYHSGVTYYTKSGNTYTVASGVTSNTNFTQNEYYEQTGFVLTLTPNAYVLTAGLDSSTGTDIELTLSNGTSNDSVATIKPGSNVTFGTSNGNVTISADDSKINTASIVAKPSSADGFNLTVSDTSGKTATGSFDPVIRVGSTGEFSDTHFVNGMATLPVYSKTQVDSLFKTFNAMEWQGVKTSGNMPTSNIKNGYVYMAGTGGLSTSAGDPVTASAGDLIIATGTEGADGYIPTANIQWQIVDAGNDLQDSYTVENTTHGIVFKKNGGIVGGITTQGDEVYLITNDTTDANNNRVVTINHKEIHNAAVTNTTPSDEVQVSQSTMDINVPTVSYDKAGHITALGTTKYTVTDTHANITDHTIGATVSGSTATITDTFKVDGANKSASYQMSSSSLSLSASNGNLTVDMTWGSF